MIKNFKEIISSRNKNLNNTNSMIIDFGSDIVIKEIPAYQVKVNKITINKIIDEPSNRRVIASTNIGDYELWVDEEYTNIGQWTNDDVEKRIKELFNK